MIVIGIERTNTKQIDMIKYNNCFLRGLIQKVIRIERTECKKAIPRAIYLSFLPPLCAFPSIQFTFLHQREVDDSMKAARFSPPAVPIDRSFNESRWQKIPSKNIDKDLAYITINLGARFSGVFKE